MSWTERFGGAALVTGASSGLGREFARALAARGMDLVLVARREQALEEVAAALRSAHGVRVAVVPQDLIAAEADVAIFARVEELGMSIGLLVNNAGFGTYGAFVEQDAGFEGRMVDVNCRAPVLLSHRFLPHMLQRGRGGIVVVASMAGVQPTPFLSVYGATKAFDLCFGEALWGELRGTGVEVVTLAPGVVQTGFQDVADSGHMPFPGQQLTAREVVEETLEGLGRRHLVVPGAANRWLTRISEWAPRRFNVLLGVRMLRPSTRRVAQTRRVDDGAIQRLTAQMLLTLLAVVFLDSGVGSLATGTLRFWFPEWLDPSWQTQSNPWVVDSQSDVAVLFFLPILLYPLFQSRWTIGTRVGFGLLGLVGLGLGVHKILGVIDQEQGMEALGFLALAAVLWLLVRAGESLGLGLRGVRQGVWLRALMICGGLFAVGVGSVDWIVQRAAPLSGSDMAANLAWIVAGLVSVAIGVWIGRRRS